MRWARAAELAKATGAQELRPSRITYVPILSGNLYLCTLNHTIRSQSVFRHSDFRTISTFNLGMHYPCWILPVPSGTPWQFKSLLVRPTAPECSRMSTAVRVYRIRIYAHQYITVERSTSNRNLLYCFQQQTRTNRTRNRTLFQTVFVGLGSS